jgi:hypothetical protein
MNPHFASLVLGLASQAKSVLDGNMPPGAEAAGSTDPKQLAKALIDTLTALEEKTKGNLDGDEEKLLSQSLTALRFQFATGKGH